MPDNNLQSAYKVHHSTETALLKVKNELMNMNKQYVTLLVLLDLSAAFDNIDHGILVDRLHSVLGLVQILPYHSLTASIREWRIV
jgi:hypothetical protein